MTKIFTENDLIRYLYGETSETETLEIKNALLCDTELNDKLSSLTSVYDGLNKLIIHPSERALDRIFKFAVI